MKGHKTVPENFAGDGAKPEVLEFEAEAVRFEYGKVAALEELSLQVRAGERIALLGANGSGKSTLLRLMDGLHFACGGTLRFRGAALTEAAMEDDEFAMGFRRRVGLVFQNPDIQLFNPTVFDEVAFGPLQMGWPREKILERVYSVLQWIGAEHLKDRAPYRLSGGEKKRVAIASVIVLDPDVLLLDEPTAALDPKSQSQVIELLESWNRREEDDHYGDASVGDPAGDLRAGGGAGERCGGGRRDSGRGAGRYGAAGVGQPDSLAPAFAWRSGAPASVAVFAA